MNADGIFNYFASRIFSQGLFQEPLLTLQSKQEQVSTQLFITAPFMGTRFRPIIDRLQITFGDTPTSTVVTRQQLADFVDFATRYSDANYRNVKTNQLWRNIYGVATVAFPTYNPKNSTAGTKQALGTYCQRCHYILPLSVLTIDHQKPQSGGEQEAMLRIFRALGLTSSTAYGVKNRILQQAFAPNVGGSQTIRDLGDKGDVGERYSLSSTGRLVYSALRYAGAIPELKNLAMNHVVNLRPMCGPCNSALSNRNLSLPQ